MRCCMPCETYSSCLGNDRRNSSGLLYILPSQRMHVHVYTQTRCRTVVGAGRRRPKLETEQATIAHAPHQLVYGWLKRRATSILAEQQHGSTM